MSKLNVYLSNIFVFNQKLHNLHWNVVGPNFKAVHEYLEEIYDGQFEKLDEVAEYIRIIGEHPLATVSEYMKHATLEEVAGDRTYSIKETLEILLADLEHMVESAKATREEESEDDNFVIVNLLEDHVEEYTKSIWFVKSMLA